MGTNNLYHIQTAPQSLHEYKGTKINGHSPQKSLPTSPYRKSSEPVQAKKDALTQKHRKTRHSTSISTPSQIPEEIETNPSSKNLMDYKKEKKPIFLQPIITTNTIKKQPKLQNS